MATMEENEMTVLTDNMTFGTFMAPFHRVGENPTLALERDLELIEWLGVILQLLDGREPVTCTTDWFQVRDATLQLRPYQKPTLPVAVASVQSPAGVLLAGKHGVSVISLSVPRDVIRSTSLKEQWAIAEEAAAAHGKTVHREDWRLSVGCHLAETREQAFDDIRVGAGRVVTEYT